MGERENIRPISLERVQCIGDSVTDDYQQDTLISAQPPTSLLANFLLLMSGLIRLPKSASSSSAPSCAILPSTSCATIASSIYRTSYTITFAGWDQCFSSNVVRAHESAINPLFECQLFSGYSRKRTLASMGTHDLDTIEGPFTYEALSPKSIKFIPLNQAKELDGEELMTFYEVRFPPFPLSITITCFQDVIYAYLKA